MPDIHAAARALAAVGAVVLTQRGAVVADPRGAYRIGLAADYKGVPPP